MRAYSCFHVYVLCSQLRNWNWNTYQELKIRSQPGHLLDSCIAAVHITVIFTDQSQHLCCGIEGFFRRQLIKGQLMVGGFETRLVHTVRKVSKLHHCMLVSCVCSVASRPRGCISCTSSLNDSFIVLLHALLCTGDDAFHHFCRLCKSIAGCCSCISPPYPFNPDVGEVDSIRQQIPVQSQKRTDVYSLEERS